MRYSEDMDRPRRRPVSVRTKKTLTIVVACVLVLIALAPIAAEFLTDYWWFQSVSFSAVFRQQIAIQVMLSLVFGLLFFVLLYGNLAISERFAPPIRPVGPKDEAIERYREFLEPRERIIRMAICVLLAFAAGASATGEWQSWLLFTHGRRTDTIEPLTGANASFFMFRLPFWDFLVGWFTAAALMLLLVSAASHFFNGSLHIPGSGRVVSAKVKAHLSVLLALVVVAKGFGFWLDRYHLALTVRTPVQGPADGVLYTDDHARYPMLMLSVLMCALVVVVLVLNTRRNDMTLPTIAIASWLLVSVVTGNIFPWMVQRFQVVQNQNTKEADYLQRNIDATRTGFGLDHIETNDFNYVRQTTTDDINASAESINNIRVLDPSVVGPTYDSLQGTSGFYDFADLDVDRYRLNGVLTQVVIGTRELNPSGIPQQTWEAKHLQYTHGYGVAIAPANTTKADGQPQFIVGSVPVEVDAKYQRDIKIDRPQIYFGEQLDKEGSAKYGVVHTTANEITGTTEAASSYDGTGGFAIDSLLRRAAVAVRFGQIEPLITDYFTDESRLMFVRNVGDRVRKVAPFLKWDADPYPVVVDGRIKYVIDGYTTSANFPNSQHAAVTSLSQKSDLYDESFNYLKNSVKAVVDSYDGDITMYLTDELYGAQDPIVRSYADAFPTLFKPLGEMPQTIREHMRYPEDMFVTQSEMWGKYHLGDPAEFFRQDERWDVAQRPPTKINETVATDPGRIDAHYLLFQLPGHSTPEFSIMRPYVPHAGAGDLAKKQLTSFLVGRSDGAEYGKLATYSMTTLRPDGTSQANRDVDGPLTVTETIQSDTNSGVSKDLSLLNQRGGGSELKFGNMQILPVGKSLIYIRPLYLAATQERSSWLLRRVIVWSGGRVEIADTLGGAIAKLFPDAKVATSEPSPETTPTTPTQPDQTVDELIVAALAKFDEADAALKSGGAGGLGDYQRLTTEAKDLVKKAQELAAAASPSTDSSTTTSTTSTSTPQ